MVFLLVLLSISMVLIQLLEKDVVCIKLSFLPEVQRSFLVLALDTTIEKLILTGLNIARN